jgi:hypothetical protein
MLSASHKLAMNETSARVLVIVVVPKQTGTANKAAPANVSKRNSFKWDTSC